MGEKLRVVSLVRTCVACPSQWEGTLDDGRMIYVRYRWGGGTLCVSPVPTTDVYDAVGGDFVGEFAKADAHEFDGDMTNEEMRALTAEWVDWSAAPSGEQGGEG